MNAGERRYAAAASRLAWALACVGLVAGVIILGLFDRALNQISATRDEAIAAQAMTHQLLESFDSKMRTQNVRIEDQLDESDSPIVAPADTFVAGMRAALARTDQIPGRSNRLLAAWNPVQEHAQRLDELARQAVEWRASHDATSARAEESRARADAALGVIRAACISAEGRQRLTLLGARRKLQAAASDSDRAAAQRALADLNDNSQVSAIKTELSDLALLHDELIYEQSADRLTDLRDNRLAPALTRLRALLTRYVAGASAGDTLGPSLLDAFETVLFGPGYTFDGAHQTITMGPGSLYELCRSGLESRRVKRDLSRNVAAAVASLQEFRAAVGAQTEAVIDELSQRAHDNLSLQWGRMLGVGAAAAGVFIVLAFRIAGRLRRVVGQVEQANSSLSRARLEAEEASRTKGEFLANMSHEIRTPMTAILGYADLLLDPAQSPSDRSECIATIRRNGEHLLTIINDILDLSKIEAGRMTVESIDCSPVQVVHEVLSLMQVRAAGKNLDVRADCDPGLPALVRSDPVRLRQILVNLVGNAIKFTQSGSVVVGVRFEPQGPEKKGGPRLRFDITDTGIGMSAEQVSRLFTAFGQADASTTRKYGGSGLGLTISRKLANLLGGDIAVSSTPGKGSCFTVIVAGVPVSSAVSRAGSTTVFATPVSPAAQRPSLAGLRILLAEDGPDNQRLIAFHLTKAGATVDIAENGRIAAEKAFPRIGAIPAYDLILMDMQMPELDGYGAASLLRQRGCPTPIIALTAHAMAEDRDRCLAAGCDDYQTKPINRDTLLRVCRDWADRKAARAA